MVRGPIVKAELVAVSNGATTLLKRRKENNENKPSACGSRGTEKQKMYLDL